MAAKATRYFPTQTRKMQRMVSELAKLNRQTFGARETSRTLEEAAKEVGCSVAKLKSLRRVGAVLTFAAKGRYFVPQSEMVNLRRWVAA